STARYAGDLSGSRKTRSKNEPMDLRRQHPVRIRLGEKAFALGNTLDMRGVEAAPVVRNLNDDVSALLSGPETDCAFLDFSGGASLVGTFDAVVGAVSHHMCERILDQVKHLTVQLRVSAVHFKADRFAKIDRKVPHNPLQLLPCMTDRL